MDNVSKVFTVQCLEKLPMGNKNIYMGSSTKIIVRNTGNDRVDKDQRGVDINGNNFRNHTWIYNSKMGEALYKLLNIAGLTGFILGFIANLNSPIAFVMGLIGIVYGLYKMLEKREDWLHKRSERRQHERENQTKKLK